MRADGVSFKFGANGVCNIFHEHIRTLTLIKAIIICAAGVNNFELAVKQVGLRKVRVKLFMLYTRNPTEFNDILHFKVVVKF